MRRMACCEHCFVDDHITSLIKSKGQVADEPCDHCGRSDGKQMAETALRSLFLRAIDNEYCIVGELSQAPHICATEHGDYLANLLAEDFEIFSEEVSSISELLGEILYTYVGDDPDAHRYDTRELWARRSDDMAHWTMSDEWSELSSEIRRLGHGIRIGSRFYCSDDAQMAYRWFQRLIDQVAVNIDPGVTFYRARRGTDGEVPYHGLKLAPPPPSLATAGRANVQGQPVLYVCNDELTAIHEIRPSIGDKISLGKFALARSVKIVDLSRPQYVSPFVDDFKKYTSYKDKKGLCEALGAKLSVPIRPDDQARDYIETQVLAGIVAESGYDGIRYGSSQNGASGAKNYVFFDTSCAEQTGDSWAVKIGGVSYQFYREARSKPLA